MRALQPQLVEQREQLAEHLLQYWPGGLQWGRLTMPGQVDGDHVPVRSQPVQDRSPGLPAMPDAVQQDQRRSRTGTLEGQCHRKAPYPLAR